MASTSPTPKRSKSPWRIREQMKQSRGPPPLPPSRNAGVIRRRGGNTRAGHSLSDLDTLKNNNSHSEGDGNDHHDDNDDDDDDMDAIVSAIPSMFRTPSMGGPRQGRRASYNSRPPLGMIGRPKSHREFHTTRVGSASRRSSVLDAIGKFCDDTSTLTGEEDASTVGGGGDSTAGLMGVEDDDEMSLSSLMTDRTDRTSLGSIAPVRKKQNLFTDHEGSPKRINQSFNLSMDLSRHANTNDLHEDEEGPTAGAAASAASDELWARFKLLGRLGLGEIEVSKENQRRIEKNVNILERALKHIISLRDEEEEKNRPTLEDRGLEIDLRTGHVLEEVLATIEMPENVPKFKRDPDTIAIAPIVSEQLRDYVTVIMSMYRNNAFHNFEHASHVLNGVNKLISCVVAPDDIDFSDMRYGCGVATEPWTQFALVFSALIHDVDHSGVPNATLVKEKSHVAGAYKNKSVAEQNSIELAWNLLMEPCYKQLRDCLFSSTEEIIRFRGLVVTAVMATDIADKELAALRKGRAAEALNPETENPAEPDSQLELVRRKATFVLETLIQASDISHTMNSFQEYKKWNRRLFDEMYLAYKRGRADANPIDTWYQGEFGFYDHYIIPLARKLKYCGVTDQACEDYVNNAIANRREWELHGAAIVESIRRDIQKGSHTSRSSKPPTVSVHTTDTDSSSESSASSSSSPLLRESPPVDGSNDNDGSHSSVSITGDFLLSTKVNDSTTKGKTRSTSPLDPPGAQRFEEEEKKEERITIKVRAKPPSAERGRKVIKKRVAGSKPPRKASTTTSSTKASTSTAASTATSTTTTTKSSTLLAGEKRVSKVKSSDGTKTGSSKGARSNSVPRNEDEGNRSNSVPRQADKKVRKVVRTKSNDLKQSTHDKSKGSAKISGDEPSKGSKASSKSSSEKTNKETKEGKEIKSSSGDDKNTEDGGKAPRKVRKIKRQKSLPKGTKVTTPTLTENEEKPISRRERSPITAETDDASKKPRSKSLDSGSEHARVRGSSAKTTTDTTTTPESEESAVPLPKKELKKKKLKKVKKVVKASAGSAEVDQ